MNYRNIYNKIINRAKERPKPELYERHHVIPKCIGGTEEDNNLVCLTYREHFICHWILHKLNPEVKGLTTAYVLMCFKNHKKVRRNSRAYSYARLKLREMNLGNKYGEGRVKSTEEINSLRTLLKGNKNGLGNKSMTGRSHSEETKRMWSEKRVGVTGKYTRDESHRALMAKISSGNKRAKGKRTPEQCARIRAGTIASINRRKNDTLHINQ